MNLPCVPQDETSSAGSAAMTPMVDLFANILLLLLASNPVFNVKQVPLPPWDRTVQPVKAIKVAHRVTVTASGPILWDKRECSPDALAGLLRQAAAKDEPVSLHMDSQAAFERFWTCYRLYSGSGFKRPLPLAVSPGTAPAHGSPRDKKG